MTYRGMLIALVALASGSIATGCGGDDTAATSPLVIVIERDVPCDAGTGSGGAGGSGSTSSSSVTTGAGGDASATASTTGATSSSSSSASGTGGAGGGMACVPTKCDAKACGTFPDDGCGDALDCGGCLDGLSQERPEFTCDAVAHVCVCTSVASMPAAVEFCKSGIPGIPAGTVPMNCGPLPVGPKIGECYGDGSSINGIVVACCVP